jgi:hypothetical protein
VLKNIRKTKNNFRKFNSFCLQFMRIAPDWSSDGKLWFPRRILPMVDHRGCPGKKQPEDRKRRWL